MAKKCKQCKKKFNPTYNSVQPVCSYQCAIALNREKEQKKSKQKDKVIRESLKTKSDWEKEIQPIINNIAREIDKESNCLMCGNVPKKKNGCHYHSVGANPTIRYNLYNIWLGCEKCNKWLGGNIIGYDNELIEYYGKEKWEYIKFDLVRIYPSLHLNINELKELKARARKVLIEVKKLPVLTHEQRWNIRKKLNKTLNIYK